VSKAREKSIYATRLADLFSNEIVHSLIDSKRVVSVNRFDRKPCCKLVLDSLRVVELLVMR